MIFLFLVLAAILFSRAERRNFGRGYYYEEHFSEIYMDLAKCKGEDVV